MTAQAGDIIIYKGKKYQMATEPLNDYLDTRDDIKFESLNTACWRGYNGEWKYNQDRKSLLLWENLKMQRLFCGK